MEILAHCHNVGEWVFTVEDRGGEEPAAFAQNDTLWLLVEDDLAASDVSDGHSSVPAAPVEPVDAEVSSLLLHALNAVAEASMAKVAAAMRTEYLGTLKWVMKESPLLTNNSQANLGLAKLNTYENTTTHVDPENGPPSFI